MWRLPIVALSVVLGVVGCSGSGNGNGDDSGGDGESRASVIGPGDWPGYGHDAQHTFRGTTSLTAESAATLRQAWSFPTGDAVTATPTVVDGTVYVGSWDTVFYAVDLVTGKQRWSYHLAQQHAVSPYPGQDPRDFSSDGGLVTSSAWYEPGTGDRPDLVIFGGGYTLYALVAATGELYWRHDYTGRPERPPDPDHDSARIFSSPVVADGKVLAAVSVDGQRDERGYVFAADVDTGKPVWVYETDVDASGRVLNDGCGNVWSSGTVLADLGFVVFDSSDCHFAASPPTSETVFALRIADGHLAWRFRPDRPDPLCDFDFGATVNAGPDFLGVGGKDGTYYSLDPKTGRRRWSQHVVFGGFAGGFIATTAYDPDTRQVYGSTALGDFGRFESNGPQVCNPDDPEDTKFQEPSVHAFDTTNGEVAWQAEGAPSLAPTTVAGGLTFNGPALKPAVHVRDAATGKLLAEVPLPIPCWSGIATVGDTLVLGTGTSAEGSPAAIIALTPGGHPPRPPKP